MRGSSTSSIFNPAARHAQRRSHASGARFLMVVGGGDQVAWRGGAEMDKEGS